MPEPVFLNIRNPTEKPIARGDGAAAREQLIKEGYDGTQGAVWNSKMA